MDEMMLVLLMASIYILYNPQTNPHNILTPYVKLRINDHQRLGIRAVDRLGNWSGRRRAESDISIFISIDLFILVSFSGPLN